MKRSYLGFLLIFVMVAVAWLSAQTSLTADQIQQQLLAQPPQATVAVSQKLAVNGVPDPIAVSFVNADLDGSGAFRFYVAFYTTQQTSGGFLRVFQLRNGALALAADQDASRPVGGYAAELILVDVNGDGIPEIEVDSMSANGQDHSFSLFMWTGSSLHDLIGSSVQNGGLADVDRNGTLDLLIAQASGTGVDVFKLIGQNYQFFKSFPQNPTGLVGHDGNIVLVRSFCKAVAPNRFPLREIQGAKNHRSHNDTDDDTVLFSFGGLEQVNGPVVEADQVDLASIVVSPHLTPLRASVHRKGSDQDDDHDNDGSQSCREARERGTVAVRISRQDFLRSLQQLQPQAPLQPGDQIEITLSASLRDGRPVSAVFAITIAGDGDRNEGSD